MERRPSYVIKAHAAQRWLVWKYLPDLSQHIRIAEFPKSGGTWLSQMVSEMSGLPFPRNSRLPFFRKCIQHSHIMGPATTKTILVVRDVRDVISSAYFHFLFENQEKDPYLVAHWKGIMSDVEISNVKESMPVFIKRFHKHFKVAQRRTNWSNHTESYLKNEQKILIIKYEDLLKDASGQLEEVRNWLSLESQMNIKDVVEKYSFKNQTKRERGVENRTAFLRKGISGDWKNHFNEESKNLVLNYYGSTLQKLDYV